MAQELQPYKMPLTTLSLEQEATKATELLRWSTSHLDALEQAKRLIGSWPHAKPGDPAAYAEAIATVLADFPLGVVKECCHPRIGLARIREFPPTAASVVEWCSRRVTRARGAIVWAEKEAKEKRDAASSLVDANGVPWIERLRELLRSTFKRVPAT